jgi:hypothetical protein
MQQHWFYTVWPFIGVGGAIVMVAILLMTDTFRGNTTVSRWRDPVWLAWLAVPLYWIHQFEEYSLPVLGFDYSIQEMICKNLGFPPYPDCPIPLSFYPVVNIALMWFGAPLAAYFCRRNVLIGLRGHLRVHDSRTVQRQGRGRGVRRRSRHSCPAFHGLRVVQERRDRQRGPAGFCRRDRFRADYLGGHREPVLQARVASASLGADR